MNKKKMYYLPAIVFGLLIGGVMVVGAFTEPTTGPSSTTSYPPINLGRDTQIRDGGLGIGNGTYAPATSLSDTNSGNTVIVTSCDNADIADNTCNNTPTVLGADNVTVQKNATLVGNTNVDGRVIVAGALRIGQAIPYTNKVYGDMATFITNQNLDTTEYDYTEQDYTDSQNQNWYAVGLAMPVKATTNLGDGNWCTTAANAACPVGSVIYRYDSSSLKSTCRFINPAYQPGTIGSC